MVGWFYYPRLGYGINLFWFYFMFWFVGGRVIEIGGGLGWGGLRWALEYIVALEVDIYSFQRRRKARCARLSYRTDFSFV